MISRLICWFLGHNWQWIYDDQDYEVYFAGDCKRCGKIGDGKIPVEPEYEAKEYSEGIIRKGF